MNYRIFRDPGSTPPDASGLMITTGWYLSTTEEQSDKYQ